MPRCSVQQTTTGWVNTTLVIMQLGLGFSITTTKCSDSRRCKNSACYKRWSNIYSKCVIYMYKGYIYWVIFIYLRHSKSDPILLLYTRSIEMNFNSEHTVVVSFDFTLMKKISNRLTQYRKFKPLTWPFCTLKWPHQLTVGRRRNIWCQNW